MEQKLEMITKWLKNSGLKVNENQTEVFLFHRNDKQIISLSVQDQIISSKNTMNVLAVTSNSKLKNSQTANAITKASKSLYSIKLISKFENGREIKLFYQATFTQICTTIVKSDFHICSIKIQSRCYFQHHQKHFA